ncbi:MAG: CPBP family glutamic-type intramembrane protease [Planctomycetota bacterium]
MSVNTTSSDAAEDAQREIPAVSEDSDSGPASSADFWSHVLPYVFFLVVVQFRGASLGSVTLPPMLVSIASSLIPLATIAYFALRRSYPELKPSRPSWGWLPVDMLLGAVSGLAWMAPYLLFPSLRPDELAGTMNANSDPFAWIARGVTFVLAVPILEELFIRSFVMRQADVGPSDSSFRSIELARFTLRSFLVTVVVFTITHQVWEWWVAIPWVMATNLWFYFRRSLWSIIVAHAMANLTILLSVAWVQGKITDATGKAVDIWFFL